MEGDSLSYKTLRNSSYFFVGYLLPLVFAVLVTPFVVHRLGVAQYGIFVLVNTINAFLGFIDLGLSTALTKFMAEYNATRNFSSLQKLFQSAQSLSYVFGLLGLCVFMVIGHWFLGYFHVLSLSVPGVFLIFALAGVVFFLNSILMPTMGAVTALQRYDIITKINVANLILSNILTVIVLLLGYQMKAIMAINVTVLFLVVIAYRIVVTRLLPQINIIFRWDREEITKAYRFGLQTFVANLAASALIYLDRLIIPIFLGPAQLSYYSLPGNVALKTSGVTNSLSAVIFPMASALQSVGDKEKLKVIYTKIFRNLSIVAASITTGIILFAGKILYFWLGAEFSAKGTSILVILALTYYFVGLYIPLNNMLLGIGKVKFLIRMSATMAVINLVSLLILVPRMGITGAAVAYLISVLPMAYAFWWVEHRHFDFGDRLGYYIKLYGKLAFTALACSLIGYFVFLPRTTTLISLLVFGPAIVLLYFIIYFLLGFAEPEDVSLFKGFISKFFFRRSA